MPKISDRITVVEMVYHRSSGEPPVCVESRFSRELETSEQPYSRRLKATEQWQSLDCGWLKDNVGMILIVNSEGRFPQANPTGKEREAAAKKVLEVAHRSLGQKGSWLIPPGESMRASPSAPLDLVIRSQSGVTKFVVHLYSR